MINLVTNNIIYNISYITFYVYSILSPQAHHPFLLRSLCSDCNLRYVPAGSVDETFRPPLPEEDFYYGPRPQSLGTWTWGPIRKGQHKSMVQTAIKYKDRSGKTRYKGAGATLKNTQFLVCNWWCHVSSSLVYSVQSLHITFRYSWYIESSKGISSEICRQDPGDERWVYQGHARAPGGASSNPLLYLICICHVPCQTMSQIATINLL